MQYNKKNKAKSPGELSLFFFFFNNLFISQKLLQINILFIAHYCFLNKGTKLKAQQPERKNFLAAEYV